MSNPLLDLMEQGESGAAGYNAYNRGTYVGSDHRPHTRGADHPIDFSMMTLQQVQDKQHLRPGDADRLFAVGKYQIIPDTLDAAVDSLGLDGKTAFTPALQDKIFDDYLIVQKRPAIHDYIAGKSGSTLSAAQGGLAREWASFADPDNGGRSHYPPPNAASVTLQQSSAALNAMRKQYGDDVAKGMLPAEAWNDVTNSGAPVAYTHLAQGHTSALVFEGSRGAAVKQLQTDLAKLGYTDAHGHSLKPDSDFGPNTRHAVEAFQRDHHLTVDGKVGIDTREKVREGMRGRAEPTLDNATLRGNPLYREAQKAVYELDRHMGRTPDRQSDQLAGAAAVAAQKAGLEHITEITLSKDGSRAFAVQGGTSPKVAHVQTADAVNTPLVQSSQAWDQQATRQATASPEQAHSVPEQAQVQARSASPISL